MGCNRGIVIIILYPLSIITDATAFSNSHFGDGEGPYHLSGLNCRGEERTLLNCPRFPSSSPIGYHTCSPGNDAGARCDGILHKQLFLLCTVCSYIFCFHSLSLWSWRCALVWWLYSTVWHSRGLHQWPLG